MKVKLAILRDDENGPKCPFGLPIPFACKKAGKIIDKMTVIEEVGDSEKPDVERFNKRVLAWEAGEEPCKYATEIIKDNVECCYRESDEGAVSTTGLQTSPFYSRVYNNVAYDGLYAYPMGYYGDENISRNLYYGIYSLQGSVDQESIEKFADYITFLNDNLEQLPDDAKNILFNFANNCANNTELLKTASSNTKIKDILRIWKDKQ